MSWSQRDHVLDGRRPQREQRAAAKFPAIANGRKSLPNQAVDCQPPHLTGNSALLKHGGCNRYLRLIARPLLIKRVQNDCCTTAGRGHGPVSPIIGERYYDKILTAADLCRARAVSSSDHRDRPAGFRQTVRPYSCAFRF